MTFTNQSARTSATGTNTPGQEIAYSFPTNADTDLVVRTRVTATGVQSDPLTLTTDYTATVSDTGGTVTMVSAIPVTETIHIIRDTPNTQSLDLVSGGSFDDESLERALDKVTKLAIENKDALTRMLRFPTTDPATAVLDMPNSIDRRGKYQFYDVSTGVPTVASSVDLSAISVSAFAETYLDDATALATMATLQGISVFNVINYGAVGDGVTDDEAPIEAAITAATINGGIVYFPTTGNAYKFLTAITVPSDVTLMFAPGASLMGDGTSTITIAGGIVATNHQVFQSTMTVSSLSRMREINPLWWGATGDGVTDDTTAVQAALTCAFASDTDLYFPPGNYILDELTHTFSDNDFVSAITIRGSASQQYDIGVTPTATLLNFSGFSDVGAKVGIKIENTGGSGGLVNFKMENLSLKGPGNVANNTTKGIYLDGNAIPFGIHIALRDVGVHGFNYGLDVTGTDNWPLKIINCGFQACHLGIFIDKSSKVIIDNCTLSESTNGILVTGLSSNITINSCLFETMTNGIIIDTTDTDILGVSITDCYWEAPISGDGIKFAYDLAGAVTANKVVNYLIMGGRAARSDFTGVPLRMHRANSGTILGWRPLENIDQYVLGTDGNVYVCIADHTADADKKPITGGDTATYWEITSNESQTTAPAWVSGTAYKQNDIRGEVSNLFVTGGNISFPFFNYFRANGLPNLLNSNAVRREKSIVVDLSGAAATVPIFNTNDKCHLVKVDLFYTEASSGDAGITIEIGTETDRDYYFTGTSEINKAIWYVKALTLLKTDVAAGNSVTLFSAGGKAGAGELMAITEYLELE